MQTFKMKSQKNKNAPLIFFIESSYAWVLFVYGGLDAIRGPIQKYPPSAFCTFLTAPPNTDHSARYSTPATSTFASAAQKQVPVDWTFQGGHRVLQVSYWDIKICGRHIKNCGLLKLGDFFFLFRALDNSTFWRIDFRPLHWGSCIFPAFACSGLGMQQGWVDHCFSTKKSKRNFAQKFEIYIWLQRIVICKNFQN